MILSSSYCIIIFLLLSLLHQPSKSQQDYLNNAQLNCADNASKTKGYFCNGLQKSCRSFVTFRAHSPYDSPSTIADLLSSEASNIASINNVTADAKFPPETLVIVPISCSCWGSIYQHFTPYVVKSSETYFIIANDTYQGLTTCQALTGQNYYDAEDLTVGAELMVSVRCACPTQNQVSNGETALMIYMITWGDSLTSIGSMFGASLNSITKANNLSVDSLIYPFTPILVPLKSESCDTNPKSIFCQCPNGQYAYETEGGNVCVPNNGGKDFPVKLVVILGVGIGTGFLFIVLCSYYLYQYLKKRREIVRKEKFFRQNGGFLLEQKFSSFGGSQKPKLFTAEELQRATDNFNQSRFLGQGGYGTVYKGMLLDGSIVAVKRSKAIDKGQINQFINEVIILSQIKHRNVVNLLGCCLETESPLLVYEYIPNGTLSQHIDNQELESTLSWENRCKIAREVAGAIAYMHSAASIPIFHRDIKSSNILLDDKYGAKVSDFGTSRSIPFDKTHLTTAVQGTFGYLDPEYFQSSQFTDKSDVYSFGVVLIELLTGQKPISFARNEEERNLVAYFMSSTKENRLLEILDPRVTREARSEEVYAIANLAIRCLRLNGKKRPTMKEVTMELEGLRNSKTCLEALLVGDEVSLSHSVLQSNQESIENSIVLSIDVESASI